MELLRARIELVMRIVGYASAAGLLVAVAPSLVLGPLVDWTPQDPVAQIIVRSWGSLIGFLGLALVYATYVPGARRLALMLSLVGKAIFIALVFVFGGELLRSLAGVVAFDGAAVLLFGVHLVGTASEFPGRGGDGA